ncbi:MAG: hypothetical protein JWM74_5599 [Myxococcaceae bacterium]|nr:hypothetical protein [Myxococcaceae bacterium]
MHKKRLLVVAVVLTAVAAGTAVAAPLAPAPPPSVTLKPTPPATKYQKVTWVCPPMIQGELRPVGEWLLSSPQGWLDKAWIAQGDSVKMLRCYYGIDKINPAAREAYFIHRAIPANYSACAIDPSNTSMTCTIN